jgi:hypothetical protein
MYIFLQKVIISKGKSMKVKPNQPKVRSAKTAKEIILLCGRSQLHNGKNTTGLAKKAILCQV